MTGTVSCTGSLNMREGPSISSSRVTTIPNGTSIEYTKATDGWLLTEYMGKTGYVVESFVDTLDNKKKNWAVQILVGDKDKAASIQEALKLIGVTATIIESDGDEV